MSGLLLDGLLEILKAAGIPSRNLLATVEAMESAEILLMLVRLVLLGLIAFMARKHIPQLLVWLYDGLFYSVMIPPNDPAFQWVRAWAAQEISVTRTLRQVQIDTMDSRRASRKDNKSKGQMTARTYPTWRFGDIYAQIVPTSDTSSLSPATGTKILWMKQSLFATESFLHKAANMHGVRLRTFSWNREFPRHFLLRAHAVFYDRADAEILIFRQSVNYGMKDPRPGFHMPQYRPARPLSSVVLPADVKARLLEDIREFLSADTRAWYRNRGIPHRRGWSFFAFALTSLISATCFTGFLALARRVSVTTSSDSMQLADRSAALAIAAHFNMDIYVINPGDGRMDDSILASLFSACPQRSMILIEDIDVAMPVKRDLKSSAFDQQLDLIENRIRKESSSRVTLSGMLNAIDGVSSQEDCLLFATTNHMDCLDDALKRPGRLDLHIEFLPATRDQVEEMFDQFYATDGALKHFDEKRPECAKAFADKLFGCDPPSIKSLVDSEEPTTDLELPLEFSMAQVQGLLLQNKTDPLAAIGAAADWRAELLEKTRSNQTVVSSGQ